MCIFFFYEIVAQRLKFFLKKNVAITRVLYIQLNNYGMKPNSTQTESHIS
jgi:hypothetical protein